MSDDEAERLHNTWVECPHCHGTGYEPLPRGGGRQLRTKQWCAVCLPVHHKSNLTLPWNQLTWLWHEERGQRAGSVRVAQEVVYAIDPKRQ